MTFSDCNIQMFERRKAAVKPGEKAIWENVTLQFMSDESDHSDNTIVKHKLSWRSESKFFTIYSL